MFLGFLISTVLITFGVLQGLLVHVENGEKQFFDIYIYIYIYLGFYWRIGVLLAGTEMCGRCFYPALNIRGESQSSASSSGSSNGIHYSSRCKHAIIRLYGERYGSLHAWRSIDAFLSGRTSWSSANLLLHFFFNFISKHHLGPHQRSHHAAQSEVRNQFSRCRWGSSCRCGAFYCCSASSE